MITIADLRRVKDDFVHASIFRRAFGAPDNAEAQRVIRKLKSGKELTITESEKIESAFRSIGILIEHWPGGQRPTT